MGPVTAALQAREGSQTQSQPAEAQQAPTTDQRGTDQVPVVVKVIPTKETEEKATQDTNDREEKIELDRKLVQFNSDLAYYTKVLVWVAGLQFLALIIQAVVFVFTLGATRKAADAADKSADVAKDTLIATQRPWVFVKLQLGQRGLFFNMNEANLDLVFLLKNTGNSPAVAVRIEGGPRIDVTINDRIMELEQICNIARNRTQHPQDWGYTIFPGDTLTLPFIYTFANNELLDKIVNEERGFIDPIVIGCIDYLFTFGKPTHHQSRFVYTVDYPLPEGGSRSINITEGNKASYLLRISPWSRAESFQAN
jgi:hypothetical protein